MPGTIVPLPVMLEEEEDRKAYEALEPPKTIVLQYGYMKMIAELPYEGDAKPGCGSKLVARTPRGIELATMLTTTCSNSGCGSSISRKQMLEYIENSGGKNYPFTKQGKVLRVATIDDINEQGQLDAKKPEMIKRAKQLIAEHDLPMRLVDVELLLGGERIIFHYTSEQWVDFRELVRELASDYQTRIEMHQVNARDEARITADYEKCGQHCCCKQFLKVLKPVSMRSAKVQKATLDPTKISGRCGRLMCCLRYEDQTYAELKKRLPHRQKRVMTDDGIGTVLDTQILTQLVLVRLDHLPQPQAFAVEGIRVLNKDEEEQVLAEQEADRQRQEQERRESRRSEPRRPKPGKPVTDAEDAAMKDDSKKDESSGGGKPKRRRRRRRRGGGNKGGDGGGGGGQGGGQGSDGSQSQGDGKGEGGGKRRRRRRRRRRGGGDGGNKGGGDGSGGGGD